MEQELPSLLMERYLLEGECLWGTKSGRKGWDVIVVTVTGLVCALIQLHFGLSCHTSIMEFV